MNTTQCNKIDKILNYGVKGSDCQPRAHMMNVSYVDPTRIFMTRIYPVGTPDTVGVDIAKHQFIGKDEGTFSENVFTWAEANNQNVFINRKILVALLNAMDSDIIRIRIGEDSPLMVTGQMDKDVWVEGIIAPRVYDEGVSYYE